MSLGFCLCHSFGCCLKSYSGAFVACWALASCPNVWWPHFTENLHVHLPIQKRLRGPSLCITTVQSVTVIPDQYSSRSCQGIPTSCHIRVINTSLSIRHAGGRISNIWLVNRSIPSVRERSSLWPSGYLLFFRNELHGIFCWEGEWWGQREFPSTNHLPLNPGHAHVLTNTS